MKNLIIIKILLIPVFFLNGCASKCDMHSSDPVCQTMVIGGLTGAAIVSSPILIPYMITKKANEAHQSKLYVQESANKYQKYSTGVANNDYEQLKQCILHCNDDRYVYNENIYNPELLETASKKLIDYPVNCMTDEEYPIYLAAYLNLIEKQRKINQKIDDVLIDKAWKLYQDMAKIAYAPQKNTQCTSPANTDISNSLQSQIRYSKTFSEPIHHLKADIFNQSLKNLSQKEVDQRFAQCPELAPNNQNTSTYDMRQICEAAYKQYTATAQLLDQPLENYKKIWRDWESTTKNNQKNTSK